jgi:hypothetical protein
MTKRALGTFVGGVILVCALADQASYPSAFQVPSPAGSLIRGQVVDASSGQPVAGATVLLKGGIDSGKPSDIPQLSDDKGFFGFSNLVPGVYTVSVTKAGYLNSSYGQRGPVDLSRPLSMGADESRGLITIRMWKPATIAGRVLDESGEPAVAATVRVLRMVYSHGARRLTAVRDARTDDRGEYRLSALPPGKYIVALPFSSSTVAQSTIDLVVRTLNLGTEAMKDLVRLFDDSGIRRPTEKGLKVGSFLVQGVSMDQSAEKLVRAYRTVYFPDSVTVDQAAPISVESGELRDEVDLRMQLAPGAAISGELVGPNGPAPNIGLHLVSDQGSGRFNNDWTLEAASTVSDPAGRFAFLGVPAGQYLLEVLKVPSGAPALSGERLLFAKVPVSVGTSEVRELVVALAEGGRLAGQVHFKGTKPRPPDQEMRGIAITLESAEGMLTSQFRSARPNADGAFETASYPPGRYILLASAPPGWSLDSLSINGSNAMDSAFELGASDIANVVVTFSSSTASLAGVVQASKDSLDGMAVIAFPSDLEAWIAGGLAGRRLSVSFCGPNGTFLMHMRPGDYLVAAVDGQAPDMQDPEAARVLARAATHVSVVEGQAQTITLRPILLRSRLPVSLSQRN